MRMMWYIRYFFYNILLSHCVSEEKKNMTKLKLSIQIKDNVEPYEIIWGNMDIVGLKEIYVYFCRFLHVLY